MSGLFFTVTSVGSDLVVYVRGKLDIGSGEQLSFVTSAVFEDSGARHLFLDLMDVTFVNPAGLRALLDVRDDARLKGCDLSVSQMSPEVERIVALSGLEDSFSRSPLGEGRRSLQS